MTRALRQAGNYVPHANGYVRSGAASSTRYDIPAEMIGKYCWFFNNTGATMYIRFGGASVTVAPTTDSSIDTEALTSAGAEPQVIIPDGQTVHVRVPGDATDMALFGGASGKWHFGCGTGED